MVETREQAVLKDAISEHVSNYLKLMNDEKVTNLYDMVMEQIEPPLFQTVIESSKYNQSRAAKTLGLSRGTFRAKLRRYFGDKYVGKRSAD